MFTKLYLATTNPHETLSHMICHNYYAIIRSVLFHTIVYTIFLNLASFIFIGKMLSTKINSRLIMIFIMIMTLGYIGRFYHVKEIYDTYKDDKKTREHLDKLYISWIFIA